ncbi:hypothetical protein JCM6882_007534 [Rhodosporidiobolus microsporus]
MAAPALSQPCLVCAQPTTNRCSACGARGEALHFCGQEHQKLVWKNAHKLVCGKPAFEYPRLSTAEADEAKRNRLTPVGYSPDGEAGMTLTALLRIVGKCTDDASVVRAIDSVTVGSSMTHPADPSLLLILIRGTAYRRDAPGTSTPISQLSNLDMALIENTKLFGGVQRPWISGLRHRLLVLFALMGRSKSIAAPAGANPTSRFSEAGFSLTAQEVINAFVEEVVGKDGEDMVAKVRKALHASYDFHVTLR